MYLKKIINVMFLLLKHLRYDVHVLRPFTIDSFKF